jgi:hypothetical protein
LEICESYVNGRPGRMRRYAREKLWDVMVKKGEELSINLEDPVPVRTDEWVSILFQLDLCLIQEKKLVEECLPFL